MKAGALQIDFRGCLFGRVSNCFYTTDVRTDSRRLHTDLVR